VSATRAPQQRIQVHRGQARDAIALAGLLGKYFRAIQAEVGPQDAGAAAALYLRAPAAAWLARVGGKTAGCVAVRPLGRWKCELKHLFVLPRYRAMHLARRLVRAVHRHAGRAGYRDVYLDTLASMAAAQALYVREGYAACAPYYEDPVHRIFMKKHLGGRRNTGAPIDGGDS
jgi:putative acetyltransferase